MPTVEGTAPRPACPHDPEDADMADPGPLADLPDGTSPGGRAFQPPAPSDPGVTVSRHPALVVLVTRVWPSTPSGRRAAVAGG